MPSDTESYRGFEVVWDVRPVKGTRLWKGQAAVVLPADVSDHAVTATRAP